MLEAQYYRRQGEYFFCLLCPHRCRLTEGERGKCGVRKVQGGKLVTTNYETCATASFDPIEKKPLYHFYPGRQIFSIGTFGCNLSCQFCQNWQLVHSSAGSSRTLKPEDVLAILKYQAPERQVGVAYTYAEPTVWFEFVLETARLLAKHGFRNVVISNGFIAREPLAELLPYIDAFNIDIKAFNSEFYRRLCGGTKGAVLQTVTQIYKRSHIELTYLLIPGLNDHQSEICRFVEWVAGLDPGIPVHCSRYFPQYKLNLPPTPVKTLEKAYAIARKRLDYVYLGNVGEHRGMHTYCPRCHALVIRRHNYKTELEGLKGKKCLYCGYELQFIGVDD